MEILKTKIAIMGLELTGQTYSEIEILASSTRHRNELSKCIKGKQTLVDG